ncbi:hypothetical protein ACFS7Z_22660 [Pontibacter toksunensis]|uniref:Lipase (Class 3) n=1 Tax=Pontibacter toksunensis TaxID=1332631 RepID=A0ABW6C1A7_9BACT
MRNNAQVFLKSYDNVVESFGGRWVTKPTAILIVHGVGHQNPLETLDVFSRGLLETFGKAGYNLRAEHHLAKKLASDSQVPWFDNFLRLEDVNGGKAPLDIYEYYWANQTEDQATLRDTNKWLNNVTRGARKFYHEKKEFAERHQDSSLFIKNGKFNPFTYWLCISFVPQVFLLFDLLRKGFSKLLTAIPIVGSLLSMLFQGGTEDRVDKMANLLNDVTIYNTTDAKSRFFKIRNCILDGAVQALKYLLEAKKTDDDKLKFTYGQVLVAGHSLGSQVAFDAINRLNHLVNQCEISGYQGNGACSFDPAETPVSERLIGLVTFGSPLDKIAFFFKEQVTREEYVRRQLIRNFHGFKQRNWLEDKPNELEIKPCERRLFEEVNWRNYWDRKDYISGSLDYYQGVTNVNCAFPANLLSFTHSDYWNCKNMYGEIIEYFLLPKPNDIVGQPDDEDTNRNFSESDFALV